MDGSPRRFSQMNSLQADNGKFGPKDIIQHNNFMDGLLLGPSKTENASNKDDSEPFD